MTEHRHSDGIMYFFNNKGCTEMKTKSASTTKLTVDDYNNLLRKYHTLEGVLATTQYRNSQVDSQVDNNNQDNREGKFKDYKNYQDCFSKNVADDPKHDPVAAKRRCDALSKNDISKEGCTKSASVNEPPAWAINAGLVEIDYGKLASEREQLEKQ